MTDPRWVHVVDDEEFVRRSLGFLLKASGYNVQPWPSGAAFLNGARRAEAGCVLLDMQMPAMDGLEVQAEMKARGIAMPVIMLTGPGDIAIAVQAMKAGAIECIEKPCDRDLILNAVTNAFEDLLDRRGQATEAKVRIAALTDREKEVLESLAEGMPNKKIADTLGISPRTVEVHRANVMAKLAVRSFPDVMKIAFAAGLGRNR